MKRTLLAILALVFTTLAMARPTPVSASLRFYPPAPYEARSAAISGNELFITAFSNGELAIFLYRNPGNANWTLVRKVFGATGYQPGNRAMVRAEGNVAAALFDDDLFIFESVGGTWTRARVALPAAPINSTSVAVDGGRVMVGVGTCYDDSAILSKSTSGAWAQSTLIRADNLQPCGSVGPHGPGDLDADLAVITLVPPGFPSFNRQAWFYHLPPDQPEMYQFGTAGQLTTFNGPVAMDGNYTYVSASPVSFAYRFDDDGVLYNAGSLNPLNRAMAGDTTNIVARDGLVAESVLFTPTLPGGAALHVWRRVALEQYEHLAIARAANASLFYDPDLSGRTLVAGSWDSDDRPVIYLFALPESFDTPAPLQEDFQGTATVTWQPLAASRLALATSGNSRVWRQSNLAGDTGALLNNADWANQSIQADIRPTAFDGADRWVGLAARWQDSNNHYYVSLRNGNRLSLRRKVEGAVRELASATLPVTTGRTYRVQLETRADEILVNVDGTTRLRAIDRALTHGTAGFLGYRSRYDIDNLAVSPLSTPLFRSNFDDQALGTWQLRGGSWAQTGTWPVLSYSQTTNNQDTFAVIGEPTDDQIVLARTRVNGFGTTSAAWAGVVARYVDHRNFYHLALRKNHQLQVRKQVNGAVTILKGRSFTVTPGRSYALRLDAVGNRLRAYVDGVLQLEAVDDAHASGRAGLATYHAAVSYEDYESYQP
jgi:hypothetical protein